MTTAIIRPVTFTFGKLVCSKYYRIYTWGEVTSQSLCSRYDRHFVGITRYNSSSQMAKICRIIQINLNQLVSETDLPIKRILDL